MNYLAHIFLSGTNRGIQIGNFIGDAVKGGNYNLYPEEIRSGILLHREIDNYADHHPLFREAVGMLRGDFGRYAAVLVDIYFDYFLATRFSIYSGKPLRPFCRGFYRTLVCHYRYLPKQVKGFVWHFILTNRLCRYASARGIQESLEIMVAFKNLKIDPEEAIRFLREHEERLGALFDAFFPEMIHHCKVYFGK